MAPRKYSAAQRAQALQLYLAGVTYSQIAKIVGFSAPIVASRIVQAELGELGKKQPDRDVKALTLARLDAMLTGLWPRASKGDVAAVDRVLKIDQARALLVPDSAQPQTGSVDKKVTSLDEFRKRFAAKSAAPS